MIHYLVNFVFISPQIVHVDNNGKWQRGPPPRGTPLENQIENVGSPTVRAYSRSSFFKIKVFVVTIIVNIIIYLFSNVYVINTPIWGFVYHL